ncbi:F-box only protein 33 [Bacillus rossius redtenbacheri]|uniref:F-box only protein 33 n=1 Tax=Bacillus rossius redtenbacheri TaxID=93214 RepID=UPI002FDDBA05
MAGDCWNNLPTVVLVDIFSYLSHKDRIKASATCKQWRSALYHPSFWKNRPIHFKVNSKDLSSIPRTRFLSNFFAKSLHHVTVSFDWSSGLSVKEASKVLTKLGLNNILRTLVLKPWYNRTDNPERKFGLAERYNVIERQFVVPLEAVIQQSRALETLNLGCSEELVAYAGPVLELLALHQPRSLRHLGLASVKEDPDNYQLVDLDPKWFMAFQKLQVLSLDYDYMNDGLLAALSVITLCRLVVHVHGIHESHPHTSEQSWAMFTQNSPMCQLRLTLIHSYEAVEVLHSHILKPSMPLTHLKVLFCGLINLRALNALYLWYCGSLTSLWWVDSIDSATNGSLLVVMEPVDPPEPIVMIAWRCIKLEELVFLGYDYWDTNLVAVSRLCSARLRRLEVAACCILAQDEGVPYEAEVRKVLGKHWHSLLDSELPDAVRSCDHDSEEFILPVVMHDQLSPAHNACLD